MILSNDQKRCIKLIDSHGTHFMQKEGSLQPSQRPIISPVSVPIYSPNLHRVYPMLYHLHLSLRRRLHVLQLPRPKQCTLYDKRPSRALKTGN